MPAGHAPWQQHLALLPAHGAPAPHPSSPCATIAAATATAACAAAGGTARGLHRLQAAGGGVAQEGVPASEVRGAACWRCSSVNEGRAMAALDSHLPKEGGRGANGGRAPPACPLEQPKTARSWRVQPERTHRMPSSPCGSLADHSRKRSASMGGKVVSQGRSASTRVRWMAAQWGLARASRYTCVGACVRVRVGVSACVCVCA